MIDYNDAFFCKESSLSAVKIKKTIWVPFNSTYNSIHYDDCFAVRVFWSYSQYQQYTKKAIKKVTKRIKISWILCPA